MRFSWFAIFRDDANPRVRISDADRAAVRALVAATPGAARATVYTPETAKDHYVDDGPSPQLALQIDFGELIDLEAALGPDGHLQALVRPGALPSLAGASPVHQAMARRGYDVPDPVFRTPAGGLACSYLVHYPGPAADTAAWLRHYVAHHPPIMRRFPGIRAIEILSRIDWIDAMPWARADAMQRNRVVFDSPEALTAALQSPVRHEMRSDYHAFPPFEGGSFHFPMATDVVKGG
jgi:uncharacterized protein (TIGR02118 family)